MALRAAPRRGRRAGHQVDAVTARASPTFAAIRSAELTPDPGLTRHRCAERRRQDEPPRGDPRRRSPAVRIVPRPRPSWCVTARASRASSSSSAAGLATAERRSSSCCPEPRRRRESGSASRSTACRGAPRRCRRRRGRSSSGRRRCSSSSARRPIGVASSTRILAQRDRRARARPRRAGADPRPSATRSCAPSAPRRPPSTASASGTSSWPSSAHGSCAAA